MDANEFETTRKLGSIFMPYATARIAEFRAAGKRFAHYSSAENIFKIISSRTMWLRNTRCMADYSEVELGFGMLRNFFHQGQNRDAFFGALNACSANLAEEALTLFRSMVERYSFQHLYLLNIGA
jgi:hypothetical protein